MDQYWVPSFVKFKGAVIVLCNSPTIFALSIVRDNLRPQNKASRLFCRKIYWFAGYFPCASFISQLTITDRLITEASNIYHIII